jgi:hypothetical protein
MIASAMLADGAIRIPAATKITLRTAKIIHSTILPVDSPATLRAGVAPYSSPNNVSADNDKNATGKTAVYRRISRIGTGLFRFKTGIWTYRIKKSTVCSRLFPTKTRAAAVPLRPLAGVGSWRPIAKVAATWFILTSC